MPYGTGSRLNLFQAINCVATIIQSLRDKYPQHRSTNSAPFRHFAISPFRRFAVSLVRPLALPAAKIVWPKHCLLDLTESMNTQLEITQKPHLIGWARGARITLDGQEVANVGTGKTVTLEVTPGKHVVGAWLGSNPSPQHAIEFVSGETVRLQCRMKMGAFANNFELTSKEGRLLAGAPVQSGHHGTIDPGFGTPRFHFWHFWTRCSSTRNRRFNQNVSRPNGSVWRTINLDRNHPGSDRLLS